MGCLLDDEREISAIIAETHDETNYWDTRSSSGHCDKITVEGANGEMAAVPWFAVWKDGQVACRVNAKYVYCVDYATNPDAEGGG